MNGIWVRALPGPIHLRTNHVYRLYNCAAMVWLQFMVHVSYLSWYYYYYYYYYYYLLSSFCAVYKTIYLKQTIL